MSCVKNSVMHELVQSRIKKVSDNTWTQMALHCRLV